MLIVSEKQFQTWRKEFNYIPVIKKIQLPSLNPAFLYQEFSGQFPYSCLMESGGSGRFSYIGSYPRGRIEGKDNQVIFENFLDHQREYHEGPLLTTLQNWMKQFHSPHVEEGPDWQGGIVGYLSYDLVREIEDLPSIAQDDLKIPEVYFLIFTDLIAYDHREKTLYLISGCFQQESYKQAIERLQEMEQQIKKIINQDQADNISPSSAPGWNKEELSINPETVFIKDQFVDAVKKVQHYIEEGDVFQVNLSIRQHAPLQASPWDVYKQIRKINPSPYMGYFQVPEFQLVSASPELLVKVKGNNIYTRPIAGTRPRGNNREEDLQLAKELIENEKEKAEHIMLVDLERNDLGKVCRYGSVVVDELMVIEEYSHVMHIVSNVTGVLRKECDIFDVIKATFPGGTITGAPKVRTMEIIEELEPVQRGPYTGSLGWLGFDGDMELNIIIRTLLAREGMAYVQAGAGIVIDSVPEFEYQESLNKGKALWKAVEMSMENLKV